MGSSVDTTMGDPTTDTDLPPLGCGARLPLPGTLCQVDQPLELPEGCMPRPVLVADVVGDGHDDVLVACAGGPLVVYPGQASGIGDWQMVSDSAEAAGPGPMDMAVAQLDGQGGIDIVLVNDIPVDGVRVFYQAENGSFTYDDFDPNGPSPTSVAIGPWFGQELPDILVTLTSSDVVSRMENNGGTFVAGQGLVVTEPRDVALGQLDGEGGVDIAVVSGNPDRLTLFFNMGGGVAGPGIIINDSFGTEPNRVLLNDIDLDLDVDILYTRGGAGSLRALRGDGMGGFVPDVADVGTMLRGLDDGDFDGNGLPDAVVADWDDGLAVFVMLLDNQQVPAPIAIVPVALGGQPWSISAGYVDGDELADVVVSTENGQVILIQSSP
ncbi:MAG: VCBS repeat-containing protein [Myxococcales bacterium]|nr:VCBS repeat-containing protein [Myxococcales bacterium]